MPNPIITKEAICIMVCLKLLLLSEPTIKPRPRSTGIVESPNISITTPPQKGDAVEAADAAKKYTSPQGNKPFNIPRKKKLGKDFECNNVEKSFFTAELPTKDTSIEVKNFILPIKEKPIATIKIPMARFKIPIDIWLKTNILPRSPKITPMIV